MGLTQEGRAPRNFLQLSAPPQTASKVSLERVAACLGAGDPPRGWAEAFKRLAILNGHADPPLSAESYYKLSEALGVLGPREKRSEPCVPSLEPGHWRFQFGESFEPRN